MAYVNVGFSDTVLEGNTYSQLNFVGRLFERKNVIHFYSLLQNCTYRLFHLDKMSATPAMKYWNSTDLDHTGSKKACYFHRNNHEKLCDNGTGYFSIKIHLRVWQTLALPQVTRVSIHIPLSMFSHLWKIFFFSNLLFSMGKKNHRMTEFWRDVWTSSSPTFLLTRRSTRAACSGPYPLWLWVLQGFQTLF